LGIWALLYALGLAVSLSSHQGVLAAILGWGGGLWFILVPLIALFFGGMFASRGAGPTNRLMGAMHGAVLWGLTTLTGIIVVGALVGALIAGSSSETSFGGSHSRGTAASIASNLGKRVQADPSDPLSGAIGVVGDLSWGVFLALSLGLASAMLGGTAGVATRQRVAAGERIRVKGRQALSSHPE
jgi:hypothetical protein